VEGLYVVEASSATRVVFDEDRRLALLPSAGDGLLHHLDRLGNINVVSNLGTGAFTGGNEYTPWGILVTSVTLQPAYTWGGALLTDGLDLVLLGRRWYRPALGRFLTADTYLLVHQDKIPGLHGAANLYLYALDNPANFSDPSGRLVFLAVLLIAAIVGAVIGAIGAAANGVDTWDEFLLWVVGGAIGGMLAVVAWAAIIVGVAAIFGGAVTFSAAATVGLIIFSVAGMLAPLTTILDNSDSPVAWFFSFLIKWVQSPITTTVGLVAALVVAIDGGNVDFRRGMLFIEVGAGGGALTLGAVAWTQSGRFNPDGTVPDGLARHESQHSRTVASIGELGFYFTYLTVGAIWGSAQGGAWNDLNAAGCGNPFEKQAHTFTNDPGTAVSASSC
jgi:RHS repeat-associated protein